MLGKNRWHLGRGFDAQLFVHIFLPKYHLDGRHRHTKQWRQKAHHVVGGLAIHGCGGDADFQLCALGLSNGVFAGTGFAQDIEHQHITIPGEKAVASGVAGSFLRHAGMIATSTIAHFTPLIVMSNLPACPQCTLENTYPDGANYVCPDCGFEWAMSASTDAAEAADGVVKDANGNVLSSGDTVILIKDLKVKGSSIVLKKGTKIKGIRLPEGAGDHEVDCKTDQGAFMLKAEFMKKA